MSVVFFNLFFFKIMVLNSLSLLSVKYTCLWMCLKITALKGVLHN